LKGRNSVYSEQEDPVQTIFNQMIRTAFVEEAYITVPTVKNWEVLQGSNINYIIVRLWETHM
jgi:hypothetical protein